MYDEIVEIVAAICAILIVALIGWVVGTAVFSTIESRKQQCIGFCSKTKQPAKEIDLKCFCGVTNDDKVITWTHQKDFHFYDD